MKRALFAALATAALGTSWPLPARAEALSDDAATGLAVPADNRPFVDAPEAGGIRVDGLDEKLVAGGSLVVTFPGEMVAPDKIDAGGAASPVVFWPPLDTEFTWTTPTQGTLEIKGPVVPGQTYRLRLREGLTDAGGAALPAERWGAELESPPLVLKETWWYGPHSDLSSRPQVPLVFNYPVRPSDAAQGVWFQDRATRQRFPSEILLNRAEGEIEDGAVEAAVGAEDNLSEFRVRPLSPLPVGGTYDLVIDGVKDAYAGRGLRYPRVIPIGETVPLEVDYVGAQQAPMQGPYVEIKFVQGLDSSPLPDGAVKIEPPVANLSVRKEYNRIIASGDFAVGSRYTVTLAGGIKSESGYTLAKEEKWGATFRPLPPTILFPHRALRERSALGLRFAFYQIGTGELTWALAPVPMERLAEAEARVDEFTAEVRGENDEASWTEEGFIKRADTELLIPALGLKPVASGTVPASPGQEPNLREISWRDPARDLSGAMLLEVTGRDAKGRTIGNRALVYFGDLAITRKTTAKKTILRVARLSDGQPVPNAPVAVLGADMATVARGSTDGQGLVEFEGIPDAKYFVAELDGRASVQPLSLSQKMSSNSVDVVQAAPLRAYTFTDRPLYRPGQEVCFKGMVREENASGLAVPVGKAVKWTIKRDGAGEVLASGETKVDSHGGWYGRWTPPGQGVLGEFSIGATLGGIPVPSQAQFRIEEFRNPPFSVTCESGEPAKPAESVITVASQYFHGAPNAGAGIKWTATWYGDYSGEYYEGHDGFSRVDAYSEHHRVPTAEAAISGTAALDANGKVTLRCDAPFKDPGNRAFCNVCWKVEVTGPDGQTIPGGISEEVPMMPVLLGARWNEGQGGLAFEWDVMEPFGKSPETVDAELFRVITKSVKERLAPNLYRFRNEDQFTSVEKRAGVKLGAEEKTLVFEPPSPGRYVLVLTPPKGSGAMAVSTPAYVSSPGPADLPVAGEQTVQVNETVREAPVSFGNRGDKVWFTGETAKLPVTSPSPGIAWVSVETDRILDTFTVPLPGNASTISIPIKPGYEPNVTVTVYALRPGGSDGLAGEMFGSAALNVRRPDRVLDIAVGVDHPQYEPRQTVEGEVRVTAGGRAVAGADLAIYAVDDSILVLGGWAKPQFLSNFFPGRPHGVVTYTALSDYVDGIHPSWLTTKGFVIGDGGEEALGNVSFSRKEFKPIILWQPSAVTDEDGHAKFSAVAPDNLTRFRVVAVGQTKASQFGAGDTTFEVTKNLLVDTALPRFLREGDEVELRAVVRQKTAENAKVTVACETGGAIRLTGDSRAEIDAPKDAPVVVTFRAKADTVGTGTVKFSAAAEPKLEDTVEITLPVAQPVILKKESVGGPVDGSTLQPGKAAPAAWANAEGQFALSVSTTPWLNKLEGLPFLLDYPHGCFEQKTSRLLAYTYLARLLAYLPDSQARAKNYSAVIEETLGQIEASLLPGGFVPYWPLGTSPNEYVTIQTAWCVQQAEAAGIDVPERLAQELPETLLGMVGQKTNPTTRAFALFVLAAGSDVEKDELVAAAEELYLQRDRISYEGQAILAIAMNSLGLDRKKQETLVDQLPVDFLDVGFNPANFTSASRTEALCQWARLTVEPNRQPQLLRDRLAKMMESSSALSTQENLWLLVAFNALLRTNPTPALEKGRIEPEPACLSPNGTAAAWAPEELDKLAGFAVTGLAKPGAPGSFVLSATYRANQLLSPLEAKGLRIERVVKDLTDPARDGSEQKPFKLGDQLLISYRFTADKPQSYVAVEDLLPAGVEVVNPNLSLFGKFYDVPQEPGLAQAQLSHSEMRDQQTNLYFDHLDAGASSYAVLARATAAGKFIWPATQIEPMYDSRFFGRSPSSTCTIKAE